MQREIASSPDPQLLHEPSWCAAASCNASAAIEFAGRSLCLDHFLPACITEIESRNERLRNLPFDPAATESLKTFIATCARQAQQLAEHPPAQARPPSSIFYSAFPNSPTHPPQPPHRILHLSLAPPRRPAPNLARRNLDGQHQPPRRRPSLPPPRGKRRHRRPLPQRQRFPRRSPSRLQPPRRRRPQTNRHPVQ